MDDFLVRNYEERVPIWIDQTKGKQFQTDKNVRNWDKSVPI